MVSGGEWMIAGRRVWVGVTAAVVLAGLAAWFYVRSLAVPIEHGSRKKNEIALTFDADMTPRMQEELRSGAVDKWYDDRIVSTLEDGSVPATFFITGLWAENYPSVVRKLSE